jgi:hypothetical protein
MYSHLPLIMQEGVAKRNVCSKRKERRKKENQGGKQKKQTDM